MTLDQIIELTYPHADLPLECDGLTRVLHYYLTDAGVEHHCMAGHVAWQNTPIPVHFWLALPCGYVIDYRLRLWLGMDAPHGVFDPQQHGVTYQGNPVALPTSAQLVYFLTQI